MDGTYELFRHHYGQPPHAGSDGMEVAATRGVLSSILQMIQDGATHLGVATDHVIESFRNDLWPGYKTGEGVEPELKSQFPVLEDALTALGIKLWPMVEMEADDALASAASVASASPHVDQVLLCTPDKDLAQCVVGDRVVQLHRRRESLNLVDEDGVRKRFGVVPASVPDYLALVGDSADGYPGLQGWGAKSAAALLARYQHLESIPDDAGDWDVNLRGGRNLAATLAAQRELAALFKDLATLRVDPSLLGGPDELAWAGPTSDFAATCARLDSPRMFALAENLAS